MEKLQELGIILVFLFGSKVEGYSRPSSDIDIGIVFKEEGDKIDVEKVYPKVLKIFNEIFPDDKLDIVFLQLAPLAVQAAAVFDGKLLYRESEEAEFSYKESLMRKCADTFYFQQMRYNQILERIK